MAGVQISVDIIPAPWQARPTFARSLLFKRKLDAQVAASEQHLRLEVKRAHIHQKTAELSLETAQAAMDQSANSIRILKIVMVQGLPPSPICCVPKMPSGRANPITGMPFTEMPWPIPNFYTRLGHSLPMRRRNCNEDFLTGKRVGPSPP